MAITQNGTIYYNDAKNFIKDLSVSGTTITYTRADDTTGTITTQDTNTYTAVKGNAETNYRTNNVNLTPENIGLGNVNNTSDADKPISTATQNALNAKKHFNQGDLLLNTDIRGNGTYTMGNIAYYEFVCFLIRRSNDAEYTLLTIPVNAFRRGGQWNLNLNTDWYTQYIIFKYISDTSFQITGSNNITITQIFGV